MRTENAKRNWVRAYIGVKLAELVGFAVVFVGWDVLVASGIDAQGFAPVLRILICLAFAWELIYCLYRIVFLYSGVRFRIPMSLLTLAALPGWYALFADLTDIHYIPMERLVADWWLLPTFTPLMVVLSFCFDINILSKINAKRETERKEPARAKA